MGSPKLKVLERCLSTNEGGRPDLRHFDGHIGMVGLAGVESYEIWHRVLGWSRRLVCITLSRNSGLEG